MKLLRLLMTLAVAIGVSAAHAADAPAEQSGKLPAGDNVQNQTQAKVRQTKPRSHHKTKKRQHRKFESETTQ